MSSSKVKVFSQDLTVTNDIVTGAGPYIHTITTATHNLQSTDIVKFTMETEKGVETFSAAVTVVDTTSFTISLVTKYSLIGVKLIIESYGATGIYPAVTWPQQSTPGVVQVVATGAATVAIEGSLDNTNFINLATFTLGAAGTDFFVMDAAWAYIRVNITSLAATKKVTVYRSI